MIELIPEIQHLPSVEETSYISSKNKWRYYYQDEGYIFQTTVCCEYFDEPEQLINERLYLIPCAYKVYGEKIQLILENQLTYRTYFGSIKIIRFVQIFNCSESNFINSLNKILNCTTIWENQKLVQIVDVESLIENMLPPNYYSDDE